MRIALVAPYNGRLSLLQRQEADMVVKGLVNHLPDQEGWEVELIQPRTNADFPPAQQPGEPLSPGGDADYVRTEDLPAVELASLFERNQDFQLFHAVCEPLPLAFSRLVLTPLLVTVSPRMSRSYLPLLQRYASDTSYVSTTHYSRAPGLRYLGNVYPGVDLNRMPFGEEPAGQVVMLTTVQPGSGIEEVRKACQDRDLKLTVLGEIQDRDYFQLVLQKQLDNDKVRFMELNSLEMRDRARLLANSLAVVVSGPDSQELLLPVLEAQACGAPVISLESGFTAEVVERNVTGLLLGRMSELHYALEEVNSLSRHQCREWVANKFSLEKMVQNYRELYHKVLESNQREDRRPWGTYEVLLDDPRHKVKRIFVYPGKRLSLQRHGQRSEHWYMVQGKGRVTLDDQVIAVQAGEAVDIPVHTKHRIENTGAEPLIFVEVQQGSYFGEDDIERFDDDFGRA